MRNMSFALTTEQLLNGTKDVTRRLGWKNLKPGERLYAVRKSQGLKKGERVQRLAIIEVVDVQREPLQEMLMYWHNDARREGFPLHTNTDFIDMFCAHNKCEPHTEITRIEFKVIEYLNGNAEAGGEIKE